MDSGTTKEKRHGDRDFPLAVHRRKGFTSSCVVYSHWHEELEFFRLDRGSLLFRIDEDSFRLEAGCAVFVPCGAVHSAFSDHPGACEFTATVFDPGLAEPRLPASRAGTSLADPRSMARGVEDGIDGQGAARLKRWAPCTRSWPPSNAAEPS